ncbi:NUDIX domain-containing protein [Mesorhizobium sp. M2D.F.Ca.ET.185.01.1.1]|uniref:NUDIX domain-containing protein n=1 Tax=unclassified Mesorhizobium TaxID=325217 RepID=UPI000FCB7901|nr:MULTISPECIES: NUDIX domain-containing protein [unclassified Mesorhizobium]TGP76401.1 NUDIX domain-containing protein [bacterium M00.F.Ca.ET.227.01.1.1]TGP92453.1 NUDIX domain-containing protein [bacterium M00.F.Ca.ET.222.01.1.1]TGP97008.1 NUDIX domain-containing protein [bacterium M00.F.Ca.ET.221.01.1.1]TGU06531.1 NUDIX domain-containing protein [bacterium M00.F.Ca.ET.163.01.1.1]TGU27842.1 NUDIX domain-containing protein [bacterium M00.F.Ca.ET.156.01.1.1]TGU50219.1 NUDIX domain-containing 
MPQRSAGLLIHRRIAGVFEFLLVHPGGPFWARKDEGAWSVPKGLIGDDEDELGAARREAEEELGIAIDGDFQPLGSYKQPGGKIVMAWSVEADIDANAVKSNMFTMEWPPKSGRMKEFPEVDRAAWFSLPEAGLKILKGQRPMLDDFLERHGAK